jgi:hypothetical protein
MAEMTMFLTSLLLAVVPQLGDGLAFAGILK